MPLVRVCKANARFRRKITFVDKHLHLCHHLCFSICLYLVSHSDAPARRTCRGIAFTQLVYNDDSTSHIPLRTPARRRAAIARVRQSHMERRRAGGICLFEGCQDTRQSFTAGALLPVGTNTNSEGYSKWTIV